MKANPYFHLPRFFLVLKRDVNMIIKPTLISFGALLGILLIATFVDGDHFTQPGGLDLFRGYFVNTLVIGGVIVSSLAFKELRNSSSRLSYLMLPASTFEKLASIWFLTSIGYTLLTWFSMIVLSWLSYFISSIFIELTISYFQPFDFASFQREVRTYWVLNAFFLLGAVIFNKYVFPKTVVSLMGVGFSLVVIGFLFLRVIFWEYFEGFSFRSTPPEFNASFEKMMQNGTLQKIPTNIFLWLVAPYLWLVTYFHLKERTV